MLRILYGKALIASRSLRSSEFMGQGTQKRAPRVMRCSGSKRQVRQLVREDKRVIFDSRLLCFGSFGVGKSLTILSPL